MGEKKKRIQNIILNFFLIPFLLPSVFKEASTAVVLDSNYFISNVLNDGPCHISTLPRFLNKPTILSTSYLLCFTCTRMFATTDAELYIGQQTALFNVCMFITVFTGHCFHTNEGHCRYFPHVYFTHSHNRFHQHLAISDSQRLSVKQFLQTPILEDITLLRPVRNLKASCNRYQELGSLLAMKALKRKHH